MYVFYKFPVKLHVYYAWGLKHRWLTHVWTNFYCILIIYSVCCCPLMLPVLFPPIFFYCPELHLVLYFIYYTILSLPSFHSKFLRNFLTLLRTVIFFLFFIYLQVSFLEKLNTDALWKPIQITVPISIWSANSKSDAGFLNVIWGGVCCIHTFSQCIVSNLLNKADHSNHLSLSNIWIKLLQNFITSVLYTDLDIFTYLLYSLSKFDTFSCDQCQT
jgi:hypothetical protein